MFDAARWRERVGQAIEARVRGQANGLGLFIRSLAGLDREVA